jgi:hypothetical protein
VAKPALKPVRGRTRAERLEARVTTEQKALIERAAALQGRTVTDFVLTSVQDAARRALRVPHSGARPRPADAGPGERLRQLGPGPGLVRGAGPCLTRCTPGK